MCLSILFLNFCEKIEVFCVLVLLLGDGRPELSFKASDRRVRADNGSMGHGLNGSTNWDGSHGSWVSTHDRVSTHDPLTVTGQYP